MQRVREYEVARVEEHELTLLVLELSIGCKTFEENHSSRDPHDALQSDEQSESMEGHCLGGSWPGEYGTLVAWPEFFGGDK